MRPKVFRNRHRPLQQTWLASCTDLKFSLDRLRTPNTIHKEVSLLSVGHSKAKQHVLTRHIPLSPFVRLQMKSGNILDWAEDLSSSLFSRAVPLLTPFHRVCAPSLLLFEPDAFHLQEWQVRRR